MYQEILTHSLQYASENRFELGKTSPSFEPLNVTGCSSTMGASCLFEQVGNTQDSVVPYNISNYKELSFGQHTQTNTFSSDFWESREMEALKHRLHEHLSRLKLLTRTYSATKLETLPSPFPTNEVKNGSEFFPEEPLQSYRSAFSSVRKSSVPRILEEEEKGFPSLTCCHPTTVFSNSYKVGYYNSYTDPHFPWLVYTDPPSFSSINVHPQDSYSFRGSLNPAITDELNHTRTPPKPYPTSLRIPIVTENEPIISSTNFPSTSSNHIVPPIPATQLIHPFQTVNQLPTLGCASVQQVEAHKGVTNEIEYSETRQRNQHTACLKQLTKGSNSLTQRLDLRAWFNKKYQKSRQATSEMSQPNSEFFAKSADIPFAKRRTVRKVHLCQLCGKVYGKTSHLKAHIRWHNDERPFRCWYNFCNRAFTRSDELQRHIRTHTGEKRFFCEQCGKRFMRSDHLNKHKKIHVVREEKSL